MGGAYRHTGVCTWELSLTEEEVTSTCNCREGKKENVNCQ